MFNDGEFDDSKYKDDEIFDADSQRPWKWTLNIS